MTSSSVQADCTGCSHDHNECDSSRRASTRFSDYIDYSQGFHAGPSNAAHCGDVDSNETDDVAVPPLDHDVETVASDEIEGIIEKDFARAVPRHADKKSGLQSVRQSMVEPAFRQPRWFEAEESISFQFKLTPRGKTNAVSRTSLRKANEDGLSGLVPRTIPASASGVSVRELSDDHTAWQRLLTSALFLIKEDHMPLKAGESRTLDLGLASSRQAGGKHLAMRHQTNQAYQQSVANSSDPAKRIKWKVVVKPVQRVGRGGLLPR